MFRVVTKYENGEVTRTYTELYGTAVITYIHDILSDTVESVVVILNGALGEVAIMGYTNSDTDDFIDIPEWAEED